jgi:dTDP-4-dehydrorhamnose reductase
VSADSERGLETSFRLNYHPYMKIAIVGAAGQLGTALQACLRGEIVPLTHAEIEITDAARVGAALSAARPDCVINAAAYNFVDRAEDEPEAADKGNALGPLNLANWCARAGASLVHVSTDYVFGGDAARTTPYSESDPPAPQSQYARSKLAGETNVQAACPRSFIVRTCGLYGPAASEGKGNFVKTMLRLSKERKELTIVNDQHCTPSYAADVAAAIARLIETDQYGLYHATNSGGTTWYEFASEIFRQAKIDIVVRPITSAAYPQKAKRPGYSVLDCRKLAGVIGGPLPPWQDALGRYLVQLG